MVIKLELIDRPGRRALGVESLKYTGIFSGTTFSWFHHAFESPTEYVPVAIKCNPVQDTCNHKVGVALIRSWVITRVSQSLRLI